MKKRGFYVPLNNFDIIGRTKSDQRVYVMIATGYAVICKFGMVEEQPKRKFEFCPHLSLV